MLKLNKLFPKFARKVAEIVGKPWTFSLMFSLIIIWLISGPFMHYSDHWQLIINTTTSVVTFLVVFLIQNTQNRDAEYIKILLEELIYVHHKASNKLLSADELSDEDLKRLEKKFKFLSHKSRKSDDKF